MTLVAPFPYPGGKRRHTQTIWKHLGDPQAYIEPFCGSAATLLNRPPSKKQKRRELINDNMGWIVNFFRAVKTVPDEVAKWMDWPTTQQDFAARQQWFKEDVGPKLKADPEWYDTKLAGVWAWGVSNSISGKYPTGSVNEQPFTLHFQGANQRHKNLYQWSQQLAERLRHVQVHCGDWQLSLNPSSHQNDKDTVGVLLDPPYDPTKADTTMYQHGNTWAEAAEWAFNKGEDPLYRIILCGYQNSYQTPNGWEYQTLGNIGKIERQEEGIWISPHCHKQQQLTII